MEEARLAESATFEVEPSWLSVDMPDLPPRQSSPMLVAIRAGSPRVLDAEILHGRVCETVEWRVF